MKMIKDDDWAHRSGRRIEQERVTGKARGHARETTSSR